MTESAPRTPGWYPDPHGGTRLRYWDGATWSEYTRIGTSAGDIPATGGPTGASGRDVLAAGAAHPWRTGDATGPGSSGSVPGAGGTSGVGGTSASGAAAGHAHPPRTSPTAGPTASTTTSATANANTSAAEPPTPAGRPGPAGSAGSPRRDRGPAGMDLKRLRQPGVLIAVAAGVLVLVVLGGIGLVSVVRDAAGGMVGGGLEPSGGAADPSKPPLARACPPPTAQQTPPPAKPGRALPGARITDPTAGISYGQPAGPWKPWDRGVWSQGTLGVQFQTGYYMVTEQRGSNGEDYLASVLSGSVPAAYNDSTALDLRCTGQQVSEDVRNSYYPRPNTKQPIRDESVSVGGRPAWASVFRLKFSEQGLRARSELVSVVLVDVGKRTAAVLYLSVPDTHRQYDADVDSLIASIKPV